MALQIVLFYSFALREYIRIHEGEKTEHIQRRPEMKREKGGFCSALIVGKIFKKSVLHGHG